MRNMLTQGDPSAELTLELMEVKHKLDKLSEDLVMGKEVYTHVGILYALKNHLEECLHELEESDKGPQEVGYDDEENGNSEENYHKFLEVFSEKAYGAPKAKEPKEDKDFYDEEPHENDKEAYHKFLEAFLQQTINSSDRIMRNSPLAGKEL